MLPLDDRFGERFAENAARFHGGRTNYTFWAGMGHVPSDVAPDLRSRSYTITAHVEIPADGAEGVLIAHGDATSGYSLFVRDGLPRARPQHRRHPSARHVRPAGPDRRRAHARVPHGAVAGRRPVPARRRHPPDRRRTGRARWRPTRSSGCSSRSPGSTSASTAAPRSPTTTSPVATSGRSRSPARWSRSSIDLTADQDVDHDAAGDAQLARE